MTGEARPMSYELHESGEHREARIRHLVLTASYGGLDAEGKIKLLHCRTFRRSVIISGDQDADGDIYFSLGTRIMRVDPQADEAFVIEVMKRPPRHGYGELSTLRVAGLSTPDPHVIAAGEETFIDDNRFDLPVRPDAGQYVKVHTGATRPAGPIETDLIRSGDMGLARWHEFSAAQKVADAISRYKLAADGASGTGA